jgi:hypothetical protein
VHDGVDDNLQRAKPGPIGVLDEVECVAALLPPSADLDAANHMLIEEFVRARGRASPRSLSTVARPPTGGRTHHRWGSRQHTTTHCRIERRMIEKRMRG